MQIKNFVRSKSFSGGKARPLSRHVSYGSRTNCSERSLFSYTSHVVVAFAGDVVTFLKYLRSPCGVSPFWGYDSAQRQHVGKCHICLIKEEIIVEGISELAVPSAFPEVEINLDAIVGRCHEACDLVNSVSKISELALGVAC